MATSRERAERRRANPGPDLMDSAPQMWDRPSLAQFSQAEAPPEPRSQPDQRPDARQPARPARSRVDDLRRANGEVPPRVMEVAAIADEIETAIRSGRHPDEPDRDLTDEELQQFEAQLAKADQKLGLGNPATPDMPFERRVPQGPEAGMPERQIARNMRDVQAGKLSSPRPAQSNGQPPTAPQMSPHPTGNPQFASLEQIALEPGSTDTAITEVDPQSSAFMQDVQEAARTGDIEQALSKINVGLATGKYGASGTPAARAWGAVTDYFSESPEGGETNAATRADTAAAQDWFQGDEARALFEGRPELLTEAAADPIAFYRNRDSVAPAQPEAPAAGDQPPPPGSAAAAQPPQQAPGAPAAPGQDAAPQQPGQPRTGQPQGGVGQATFGGMQPAVAAQFQELARPRMSLEEGGGEIGQPIVQARTALADNANADNQGEAQRPSQQQTERGTAAFMRHYRETAVPRKIETLIQAGKFESAQRLQTWLESERTVQMQEDYARAVTAASLGDERGFFDNIGRLYNTFDDGYSFLPDQSDLRKGENGETIAVVAMRNDATGETFVQEYEGGEELIQSVLTRMEPTAIFEQLEAQAMGQQAAIAEQHQWEIEEARRRISQGWDNEQDRQTVARDIWDNLTENDPMFSGLSGEEKVMRVQEEIRALRMLEGRQGGGAGVPVYTGQ